MTTRAQWLGRALGVAILAGSLGACDFTGSTTTDPNNVPTANLNQLFTAVQVNTFFLTEGQFSRVSGMWTQQMAGVTSQFTGLDLYKISEEDADGEMASIYTGGGLIDIRKALAQAEEEGDRKYAGILKIHEAYLIGTAADIFGDVPYSEAVSEEVQEPKLDGQLEVYAAIQTLLDGAIADLQSGAGVGPVGSVDMNFRGDVAKWTAVAHSLKARYYLHTAEVDPSSYARALAEAKLGVRANSGNWRTVHGEASLENNMWHQFVRDRPGHIVAGYYLTNLLNGGTPAVATDDDPRLRVFFAPAVGTFAGQYIGSFPGSPTGDPDEDASPLNIASGGAAAPEASQPIIGCAETEYIIAEAAFRTGDEAEARAALGRGLACEEGFYGVTLPDANPALSGTALFEEIMKQKYIALFLNYEAWNDYKRTCRPQLISTEQVDVKTMPARLYYGTTERQSNTNVPSVAEQDASPRNANDPNPC